MIELAGAATAAKIKYPSATPLRPDANGSSSPANGRVRVAFEEVEATCLKALLAAGVPRSKAELQLSLLLEAELRGYASHGLLRLPRIVERIANGVADPRTTGSARWRGSILEVDGKSGLGPVVAMKALDRVCTRAARSGVAMAVIRDCNHLGMLAWYAEKVAMRGQALIGLTISEALVHPWGGRQAMLGTNPITIGVPAEPHPFVFDMATSVVSMGKIHDHANRGEPIPPGWALDGEGNPTTDASAAREGAIAPFGGAKGYALGLAFEVLVAGLTASAVGRDVTGTLDSVKACNKGDVFIVMETATGAAAAVSAFLDAVRHSPPADQDSPVRVPGDRSLEKRAENVQAGVALAQDVWTRIQALAAVPRRRRNQENSNAV